ncbi:MAG: hypothetical protein HDQ87_09990, partial [Clostridia bacterium]|nr:hypothetical protein [Clostridia bacterium]
YSDLDRTVVVFLTQQDLKDMGKLVYRYRTVLEGDPKDVMPKATEYLFVNEKDPDRSTALGRIIADIQEPDPDLIQTEALRRRMKMLKSSADGRKKMEDLMERYASQVKLGLLYEMVHDHDITLAKAAKRADMSEDAFQAAMQEYEASQKS